MTAHSGQVHVRRPEAADGRGGRGAQQHAGRCVVAARARHRSVELVPPRRPVGGVVMGRRFGHVEQDAHAQLQPAQVDRALCRIRRGDG